MNSIGKIGIIMPEIVDPLDYEMLDGAYNQAVKLGYDIIIYTGIFNSQAEFQQDYYTDGLENIYSLICKSRLDGIIFAAERFHNEQLVDKIYDYLTQTDTPCLTLGYKREGFPYINAEQHDATYAITKHLINDHGCKKIYCIAGFPDHEPSKERLQGFIDAMNDSGLEIGENSIHYGYYWINVPKEIAVKIADGSLERPDGVVCLSDTMAISFIDELKRNGVTVPDDLAVTGYDGIVHSILHEPQITTVAGRDMQIGETSVCRLYNMMTGKTCKAVGCTQNIRYGTSCGCGYEKITSPSGVMHYFKKHIADQIQRSYYKKTFIATDYINRIADSSDLNELMYGVDNTGHILKGWKWIDIVLCEDWKSDFDNPDKFRQHSFSDRMYLALSKRYGTNDKSGYFFPTKEILPALNNSHEPMAVVLTSLHCNGQVFGYCSTAYDSPDDIDLDKYYINWCDAISSGLSLLQKKLYIDYVHQQMENFSTIEPVTGMLNKRGFIENLPDALHKLRKACQGYNLLLISWLDDTDAYDTAVIIANALKKMAADKLCGRLSDNIFSVLTTSENDTETFISELKSELTASLGNPAFLPELFSETYEISGKLPAVIEESVNDNCSKFSQKRSSKLSRNFTYREQIYSLRREIMTQPQLDWNIPDISRKLSISKTHLQRLYRELFSTTIKDDIILSRMSRAMQLLTNTDLRVQEIAEQCGYQNENHFMRQFKEKTGMTALQYRRNNQ
ncbi:MAG: substrate-binding domain-containing protein [Oscillospiraceae bacterium]|nr:substrate-binding domain-containing protein [Oscillospiraceae bacterium]